MILIALGANLPSQAGAPQQTLRMALAQLQKRGVVVERVSDFFATPAWPDSSTPAFVNAVAAVSTALQPVELLALLHGVETDWGRMRSAPNAPRSLDLDLIDHDGRVMKGELVLPHPRAAARAFVLVPLAQVAPDWRHPVTGQGIAELLAALPAADRAAVKKLA